MQIRPDVITMNRLWTWPATLGAIALLAVVAYDRSALFSWVGNTDLRIEFAVVDATTGLGIERAKILVKQNSAHPPRWRARIVAEGYRESGQVDIEEDPEYIRKIKRVGPGTAEMVVRVALTPF